MSWYFTAEAESCGDPGVAALVEVDAGHAGPQPAGKIACILAENTAAGWAERLGRQAAFLPLLPLTTEQAHALCSLKGLGIDDLCRSVGVPKEFW